MTVTVTVTVTVPVPVPTAPFGQDPARNALMLSELRLPTTGRLWAQFAERSDKKGWPAATPGSTRAPPA